MVTVAIILCAAGLLVLPLSRLYVSLQSRRRGSRMADAAAARRFRNIARVVSAGLCLLAILILHLVDKGVIG
ncbi:MAG: hypothetical protein K2J38_02685 [Muribaculaceae bacterium]|nr:hypothetical protein [Muribaculaceae bacterium]